MPAVVERTALQRLTSPPESGHMHPQAYVLKHGHTSLLNAAGLGGVAVVTARTGWRQGALAGNGRLVLTIR
jgi:hypothetical protein